jgi:hypothetical protein
MSGYKMYKCQVCNCMYFTEIEAKECEKRHEEKEE